MRVPFLIAAGPLLLLGALTFTGCGASQPDGRARNVVLVSIDTCRADRLGCYGYPKPTSPHLDALAASGTLFEQASSTAPITLPSHSSLLTGTLPPRHRVFDNKYHLAETSETLAETLSTAGWSTAAFVSAFVLDARFGIAQGFEVYDDDLGAAAGSGEVQTELINERRAQETNQAAFAWLDENHGEPFFLFLHYFDPHARYDPPAPFDARFPGDPYAGEIAYVDQCIGDVLARLEALGRADDTAIVITSDHGESLDEHGEPSHSYFAYQSTLRVPLLMRAPGGLAGVRVARPVSLVDVAPTLLSLLGLEGSAPHVGRDLSGLLYDQAASLPEAPVYGESLYPTKYRAAALRSLRRGRWKYIWTVEDELYDLDADPGELVNLAQEQSERAAALEAELMELLAANAGEPGEASGALALDAEAAQAIRALGYADAGVREGFDIDPDAADAKDRLELHNQLMSVHLFTANGELERAHALGAQLVSEHPWLLEAHGLLGGLRARQGRRGEAIAHYQDYLRQAQLERARDPQGADERLNPGVVGILVALADLEKQEKRPEKASLLYQQALSLEPEHVGALVAYASLLSQGQRRFDQAAELYRRALSVREDSQIVHANLGTCLYALGDLDGAVVHYQRALELAADPAVSVNLGGALNDLGRAAEARAVFEGLSPEQAANPRVQAGLGSALMALGERQAAEASFGRARAAAPNLAEAVLGLARCRRMAGDLSGARGLVAGYLGTSPAAASAVRRAAVDLAVHADEGLRRPEDALLFAQVLNETSGGERPDVLDALGMALAANGRFEEAQTATERALSKLAPGDAAGERLRARIQGYRAGRAFVRPASR